MNPLDHSTVRRCPMRRWLRDNGLTLTMFALFFEFLVGQSIAGWRQHNDNQMEHRQAPVTYAQYVISGDFVESVFENWESEFLQMGAYVVFTAFLFQRGGAESKDPVFSVSVVVVSVLLCVVPFVLWSVVGGHRLSRELARLVRVSAELAERVSVGGRADTLVDLVARARLAGVVAGSSCP